MTNPLSTIVGGQKLDTEKLPYTGETFVPGGESNVQAAGANNSFSSLFHPEQVKTEGQEDLYKKYRDPKTGEVMSPEEYAVYLGNKVPGSVTKYAGDAMLNPNQTSDELISTATNLNNARNDIATGTTDPYKVANKSGIAYSPTELKAIENAYAGIYDPALNDVFSRLREKQAEEEKIAAREEKIFATNEAIRQWKATTGSKSSASKDEDKTIFTPTQLAKGASSSGLGLKEFEKLDDEIKNIYINPPMVKVLSDPDDEYSKEISIPIYEAFEQDFQAVLDGTITPEELEKAIMAGKNLPIEAKLYFIGQIPDAPDAPEEEEEKEGWWSKWWSKMNRVISNLTGGVDTTTKPTASIGGQNVFTTK